MNLHFNLKETQINSLLEDDKEFEVVIVKTINIKLEVIQDLDLR